MTRAGFPALILLCSSITLPSTIHTDLTSRPALWCAGAEDHGPRTARLIGTDVGSSPESTAIALNYFAGAGGVEYYAVFPKFRNANWDLSEAEYITFDVNFSHGIPRRGANPVVYLRSQDGPFIRIRPKGFHSLFENTTAGEWQTVQIPLTNDPAWEIFHWLSPSPKQIDFFEIAFTALSSPQNAAHHVLIDAVQFSPHQPEYIPPNTEAADLNVLIIERSPTYERYHITYDGAAMGICVNADQKHYPDPGEIVTFTARVQNKGKAPMGGTYVWLLDGREVGRGEVMELKPGHKAAYEFTWAWDPGDHDLTFTVIPEGEDYCEGNNTLTIRTNAILLKHVIERGTQSFLEQKTTMIGSYSFEDWLQGQVRFMNQLFAESTYDFAPSGITTRVMIGKFEYVDDGFIAETCPVGPFQVGEQDIAYDGGRGCTMRTPFWDTGEQGATFLNFENFMGRSDGAWLHELSHQIGLIDNYQFITEPEDNLVNGVGFNYVNRGLMGGGEIHPHVAPGTLYSLYSPGDVHALNVTKGRRRGYFGEYLYCLPTHSSLVVIDMQGNRITNAIIRVYQTKNRKIDTQPEHEGMTDSYGRFRLQNRPVEGGITETGCELRDNPFGLINVVGLNGVFLVVVQIGEEELYGFTTIQEFNIAWTRGDKDTAEIPVAVQAKGTERYYVTPYPFPEIK